MSRSGFCVRHGLDRKVPDSVPEDLLALPKVSHILYIYHRNSKFTMHRSFTGTQFILELDTPKFHVLYVYIA